MAPRVEVRPFRSHEGRKLQAVLHQAKDAIATRRAEIILGSAQGDTPPEIARRLFFTPDYVRKVIHAFNEEGLASLHARYHNGGAPKKVLPEHESELIELAMTPPPVTGQPFTHWSLQALRDVAVERGLVPPICIETVRQILKRHRFSLQRTKTWKQSSDPDFECKKNASRRSTRRPRRGARR
jgi:transposase